MAFDQQAYMRVYRQTYMPEYRKKHPEVFRKCDMDRYVKARSAAFAILGNVVLCGETELEFLTVDHINGGECQDRKNRSRRQIYVDVANGLGICNFSKHLGNGVCVHQRKEA